MKAIHMNNIDAAMTLLERGADIDLRNGTGQSAGDFAILTKDSVLLEKMGIDASGDVEMH